ncbi:ABC transporter substrate-binding protein [Cohnella suwonensis]|uniref:ABC transporter substrate-binding protein n=1 Tax=Cohnella suwonensis TaxID=696072 RepID=A0ABW0M068_9BACL
MKTRLCLTVAIMLIFAALASACTDRKKEPFDRSEHVTLKVLGDGDEKSFYSAYGNDFNDEYPNIEFEFVSFQDINPDRTIEKFIETEKPDIVIAQRYNYPVLAESGLLAELDPFVKRDGYDLSTISPPVIDLLRATDSGSLYGLAPFFNNSVLYYNAALFRQYKVEPPRNGMSWEQLLQLAKRFPADSGISGLSLDRNSRPLGTLGALFAQIGKSNGLRLAAVNRKDNLVLDTEGWIRAAETAALAYRSGTIAIDDNKQPLPPDDAVKKNRFISGDSAMTIGGFSLLQLIDRHLFPVNGVQPIDYGIVTVPIDPSRPEVGTLAELGGVLCLYKNSEHREAAWAFIQYLGGDVYAKLKSQSSEQLISRTSHQKDLVPERSLEPFYSQHADPDADAYAGINPRVYGGLVQLFDRKLKQAAEGEVSVQEAIDSMVSEGNTLVKSWREKVNAS